MIVSDLAVRQRVTVFALTAVIIITGTVSYLGLPLESFPDVNFPHVFVSTVYRGASPEDMEKITIDIEKKLKGLEGVKKIKSVSSEGSSSIDVEFTSDVDIDDALVKVKDKVDLAKPDLPSDLEDDPSVFEVNFSAMPVLVLSLSGPVGLRQLTKIAEDLEDDIEAVNGVLDVTVSGGATRQIQVEVMPERMATYGISFTAIQAVLRGENANVSGGGIRTPEGKYKLRVPGEFASAAEAGGIVIGGTEGRPVYLRDVARVIDGVEDRTSYSRTNGHSSISLFVSKRTGENVVRIVGEVDHAVERARQSWPSSITVTRVSDQAKEIHNMVVDLENNIITGLLLVVLVVMFAMGLRNSVLVSLSIPLSMLLSFIVLSVLGITLNMVVLFSLILALGMLVDNAIVITENVYRFMQQGVPRLDAAMYATGEVAWPIIGSSLTTIAAFFPLLFWTGLIGEFMSFLPETVIITLSCCLFVALVINPALAAVFMKADSGGKTTTAAAVMSGGEHPMLSGGGRIVGFYRAVLRLCLRYRLAVVCLAGATMLSTLLLWLFSVGIETPAEFFPKPDPNNAWVEVKPPEGSDLDYTDAVVREIACRLMDERAGVPDELAKCGHRLRYDECLHPREAKRASGDTYDTCSYLPFIEFLYEKASEKTASSGFRMNGGDNQVGLQFVNIEDRVLPDGQRSSSKSVIGRIDEMVRDIPGAEITVGKEEAGPPTGSAINIEISGADFATLGRLSEEVKRLVESIPHTRNVRTTYERGSPTLEIRVDRAVAGSLGLTVNDVGFAIKCAINGVIVSTFREQDKDYDIVVRFPQGDRREVSTLDRVFIPGPAGVVPLSTVARIKYTGGLGDITRIDNKRVVTVKADIDEERTTGDTARGVAEKLMAGAADFSVQDVSDWKGFAALLQGEPGEDGGKPAREVAAKAVSAALFGQSPEVEGSLKILAAGSGKELSPGENLCNRLLKLLLLAAACACCVWHGISLARRGRLVRASGWLLLAAAAILLLSDRVLGFDSRGQAKTDTVQALNGILASPKLYSEQSFAGIELDGEARALLARGTDALSDKELARFNRLLLEAAFRGFVAKSPPFVAMPSGYAYTFTGENEQQQESAMFLRWAGGVALLLILLVLVAQFDSVRLPLIIMSSVVLSLGGVFLGLACFRMPFGIIMTGIGVISLAGVVVNNAIVLIDYIEKLVARGIPRNEAIVAAGATRLRPVMLTATTTVLALIPMITGISYDFVNLQMQWVSESSQFWRSMAVAVIFGLGLATMLTLIVVPVLYSLLTGGMGSVLALGRWGVCRACGWWWGAFDRKHGTNYAKRWRLTWEEAALRPEKREE